MCWSATADLVAGGAVAAVGVVCVARVRRVRDVLLASLPLLLGAHQMVESVVWRGELGEASQSSAAAARTAWAVIALPVPPVLVPLGVLLAVPEARRRVAPLLVVGLATAAASGAGLAAAPVTADVRGHTLGYGVGLPDGTPWLIAGYLLATLGSLLVSGDRVLRLLGVAVAVGAALCAAAWRLQFISTWCAFAAVVSALLLWWVARARARRSA